MSRTMTINRVVIPLLAVAGLGYAVVATEMMRPKPVREEPLGPPPVRAFERAVAAVGLVEPASEVVRVSPRVSGWVRAVHVQVGQNVKAGEPLFTLDGADLEAEAELRTRGVEAARARLERLRAMPRAEDVPPLRAAVAEAEAELADRRALLEIAQGVSEPGAIGREELSRRREAVNTAAARLARAQAELERTLAGAWAADVAVAERELAQAKAAVERVRADLARLTTPSPMDGVILRVNVKAGEYAAAGRSDEPAMALGSGGPLHVRVDVNEEDAGQVGAGAQAVAMARGEGSTRVRLGFVKFEPWVVPKRSLTGGPGERVDTRVLQVVYRVEEATELRVGQQVDVFIERGGQ